MEEFTNFSDADAYAQSVGTDKFDPMGDITDSFYDGEDENLNPTLVEATAVELAAIPTMHYCGAKKSIVDLAAKYPDIKIRTCLTDETDDEYFLPRMMCSPLIYCESADQAEEIGDIACLRPDYPDPFEAGWHYFESE